jgi:RNA polymerase sigma factor (sigma-70 family)
MTRELKSPRHEDDVIDQALVGAAVAGDQDALTELVRRHQRFVYDLAMRMLGSRADAEDATQEILLRIVTNLASFRGESAFRTWAYRVAVRHVLGFRSRRRPHEPSFAQHGNVLDRSPDTDLADEAALPPEEKLVIEEVKATCLSGLLLCLDREHRIAFVLGEIFEATDVVCAELLGISRDNVRQRISRAREQLGSFLKGRCSLIDPRNPCRCARKTRSFIQQGFVDPTQLKFTSDRLASASEGAAERAQRLEALAEETYARLLRAQGVGEGPDFAVALRECMEGSELRRTLELDN